MVQTMMLFAGLRKLREFERLQLPFIRSITDFDIVIEIGYAEEQGQPLTPKQLFLLNVSPQTTVRRKLDRLIAQGVIRQRKHAGDKRSRLLVISPSTNKLMGRYSEALISISATHFK